MAYELHEYKFYVFEMDGWAWLTDLSERTHYCSTTPLAHCEPLYPMAATEEESEAAYECPPEADLYGWWAIKKLCEEQERPVEDLTAILDDDALEGLSDNAGDALVWDAVREEVNGNCRI